MPEHRTIAEVIADPSVHIRLKRWLVEAIDADPVDALADAKLLYLLLKHDKTRISHWDAQAKGPMSWEDTR